MVHLGYDGASAAYRLNPQIKRCGRLDFSDAVVVDNLDNFSLLHTADRLPAFVVVNEDNLFAVIVQQITFGNGGENHTVFRDDWKPCMIRGQHIFFDIIDCFVGDKVLQIFALYKVGNGDYLG
ncbi:hypothetical protein SDC9_203767 [bioreactor metagenome]|uniref:Uncharacterized protein n=1 Tax=bioreactor metagenome TaxID=1076179 RepID=A0A645IXM0_9ZZZZ